MMSSSQTSNGGNADGQLVTVATTNLKERLNKAYSASRTGSLQVNSFEKLWDLKEMALLEGRPSIEVPRTWLDELKESQPSKRA